MNLKNYLNPKNLIIDTLVDKFEKNGLIVNSIFCVFDVKKESFMIEIETPERKENIQVEEKELSLIKGIFISKVLREQKKHFPDNDILKIIINIEISSKNITTALEVENIDSLVII